MLGGDAQHVVQTQAPKVSRIDLRGIVVAFVHNEQYGWVLFVLACCLPKDGCRLVVGGGPSRLLVDHEQDEIRLLDGQLGLLSHRHEEVVFGVWLEASRVDEQNLEVTIPSDTIVSVSCDTRPVVHQCLPRTRQAIEEGRLAHIWASYDGDYRNHRVGLSVACIFCCDCSCFVTQCRRC